jgi:hypothetical protein
VRIWRRVRATQIRADIIALADRPEGSRAACGNGPLADLKKRLTESAKDDPGLDVGSGIMAAEQVRWSDLGCPTKMGPYRFEGEAIRVKTIHLLAAENDPNALFTVLAFRPPLGPAEFMLGHRID